MPASKRLRAPLILIVGALIVMTSWVVPASAAPDPQPTASVSDRTPTKGSSITFCGTGFLPGERMEIRFVDLELGADADASGKFCKTFPLVADHGIAVTGPQNIGALGITSGRSASIEIVISSAGAGSAPPATGGELAFTGAAMGGVGGLGGLLLLFGTMMVFAARARNFAHFKPLVSPIRRGKSGLN